MEETEELEKEYGQIRPKRGAIKKAKLLLKIKVYEQTRSEWKAKIGQLRKLDSE